LDEPESGLDEQSRRWLRDFLNELATSTRVLIIAHDATVIPDAFARHCCEAHESR
jgi:ABC-type multidrug transport system ATPase subunit